MTTRFRQIAILFAAAALACSLTGCASINDRVSAGMADSIPQWAGGLPRDAPPRPGTAAYDEFMKERERKRLMPAAERGEEPKPAPASLEPVH
jgi:hypothetical protein